MAQTTTFGKFCLLAVLMLLAGSAFCQTQTFTADGTFTVPAGVTSITVEVWGAGGRGASMSNTTSRGGGGGGGAYARKIIAVTPGSTHAVKVGLGSTSTSAGDDSWFGSTATVLAKGGNSAANNSTAGANGGTAAASIGDIAYDGGNGATSGSNAGGGGSSAGRSAAGTHATDNNGATAPASGGNGGNGRSNSAGNGSAGSIPGGGGGGSIGSSSGSRTGGAGANGRVVVNWGLAEVSVSGNSTLIADGATTTSSADFTAFGNVDVTSGTITRTFVISNIAGALSNLSISGVAISGVNAADFTVTTAPASSVAPGSSTSFVVTFNPSAIGTRVATITVNNSDLDQGVYDFAISGVGTMVDLDIRGNNISITDGDTSPASTDLTLFSDVEISLGSATNTFTIINPVTALFPVTIGAVTLTGTNANQFSVTQPGATSLAVGESTTFTVTFNPSTTGAKTAVVNVANNSSSKNPYNFTIQGTGTNPEIDLVGNSVSIVNNDATPSVSDGTDFGTVSIEAGATVNTFSIRNTGTGIMNVTGVSISGTDAASFILNTSPASTVAAGSSTTFTIEFNPTSLGAKNATITVGSDDANENPYSFAVTGLGVQTFLDTDGDGVTNDNDLDDDNDGIIDTLEETNCASLPYSSVYEHTFLNETFGTGATRGFINVNIPNATCNYCFEDGVIQPNTTQCPSQSTARLDDGEYTVVHKVASSDPADPENIHLSGAWNGPVDHTPDDVQGRMAVFNASFAPGTFYETTITGILPNVPIDYSFWVLNIMSTSNYVGSILPNITVEFLDMSSNVLSSFNTGDIGRCNGGTGVNTCTLSEWQQFSTTVNLGTNTQFIIRFKNNAPGGGGNDLAIDDIVIRQDYCDRDGDGVANMFDLDADNDGIPDIEEAGFKSLTAGRAIMDLTATWADANANGLHDAIDALIAAGTYTLPDFDGDSIPDFIDLDSDNDAQFDVDEAGLINGDGDVDGNGVGDGADSDSDGVLDIFESFNGWGTQVRAFAQDTDSDGAPDQLDLDANNDAVFDITVSLYSALDTNANGIIDSATDADKDGILDDFDTTTIALGSPRDLDRKLFLELDGRNDYAESTELLGNLGQATIMGWVKLSSTLASNAVIMGQDNFNLSIATGSGNTLSATANGNSISCADTLSADRWYHIAAVYNGSSSNEKLVLYVNGQSVNSTNNGALSGTLSSSTAKFTIGKNALSSSMYFKGSVDEVRVFNTALSADQLQKMVYQEIKQNGTAVRGEIIPKDIETTVWSSLLAYYRMDTYKGDVIDNYSTTAIDEGADSTLARIYNVKTIDYQLAPMPFVTTISSTLDAAVSQNNFVHGMDIFTYKWAIVYIKHNLDVPFNQSSLGMIIDQGVEVNLSNNNAFTNTWYLKLDGKLDLDGRAQLVQTENSDLDSASTGYLERDQQGQTNRFNYNYWSSPVCPSTATSLNDSYTVASVMKDGTDANNWQDIQWTSSLNSSATTPITLSSYWIFKYQNITNGYSNWSTVGPNGTLLPGQGYTLKGSNASTPDQNYVFVGKPYNGTITNPIAPGNINLSGNPYTSAVDADRFITDNLSSTTGVIYMWEHFSTNNTHVLMNYQGGYATRNLVGGTPPIAPALISNEGSSSRVPGRFIPVGQAFFMAGNGVGGQITFNNSQRAFVREDNADSSVMFRNGDPSQEDILNNRQYEVEADTYKRVRLGYNSPDNYHRQILLGFMDEKADAALNPGYDAQHIDAQPSDMYFMLQNVKLNIQGESYFDENTSFPIGIKTATAGTIQLMVDGLENFENEQSVYIYDNVTGAYYDITSGSASIELPAGIYDNRFSLRFKTEEGALDVQNPTDTEHIWIAYDAAADEVSIKNNLLDVDVKEVILINMLGQQVARTKVAGQPQDHMVFPVKEMATGTYIVKMVTTSGETSKKIAIQ